MSGSAGWQRTGVTLALFALVCVASRGVGAADFSAQEVYRRAAPSVVMVYARMGGRTSSTGTGSIIDARGFVLTNHHVVSTEGGKSSSDIAVFFKPARVTGDMKTDLRNGHRAVVVARSPKLDLALLRVEGGLPSGIPALAFGNSEQIEIGESVAAIGHPGGGGLWTLTTGTISSARRRGDVDVFQTDAAITSSRPTQPSTPETRAGRSSTRTRDSSG
jgi:S1-C subfamily serine protease